MSILNYVKVSDIEYKYCFLEVSRSLYTAPFMDIRISSDRKLSFCIYENHSDNFVSDEEWIEIYQQGKAFLRKEIANEDSINNNFDD